MKWKKIMESLLLSVLATLWLYDIYLILLRLEGQSLPSTTAAILIIELGIIIIIKILDKELL